ncbi:Uncharacterised protein [Oligella urethralis]|uniref:Uncharacterized protein n=1 Tax=Oligella urethralis TaxID=90245 RepID=A0A2X1UPW8_9BURK|nr:Uncharacterised protein [Oligella urethralis]SUA59493.1 Uncharacterised protein [Oligella urethralis]
MLSAAWQFKRRGNAARDMDDFSAFAVTMVSQVNLTHHKYERGDDALQDEQRDTLRSR